MLKGKLLIALASAVLFLGACSNETTEPQQAPETSQEATTEGYTGEVKYETLYDPTGAKTDVVSITMNFESGKPTSVAIDVLMDGQSKKALAASGEYVMSQAEGELKWHEQMDLLEDFIVANNFDTTKVNLTDEDGHTDAVTGVSIKVGSYLDLVTQALEQTK